MSTTTTNFGWTVPQSTDLVKDGATAIATLGSGIDTTMVDLKGGTTGQVLSKTTNTDMDFTWVTPQVGDITAVTAGTGISGGGTGGDVTITNSMATAIDAKGDLVAGTGADTFARLAVGTDGQLLTASSAASTGLAWTTVSSGGMTQLATVTHNNTTSSWNVSSIASTYNSLLIVGQGLSSSYSSGGAEISLKFNNDAGTNYSYGWIQSLNATLTGNSFVASSNCITISLIAKTGATGAQLASFNCQIPLYASSQPKFAISQGAYVDSASLYQYITQGNYSSTSAINQITLTCTNGTLKTGTFTLYGVK